MLPRRCFLVHVPQMPRSPTAIQLAARAGHIEIIKVLAAAGGHVDAEYEDTTAPLHMAAVGNQAPAIQTLIELGARPEAKDEFGWTPLHVAAMRGGLDACKALLQHCPEPNSTGKADITPTMWAAANGHLDILRAMMEAGGDITCKNIFGRTPLHMAAQDGSASTLDALLHAGADLEAIDHVRTIAANADAPRGTAALLIAAGADMSPLRAMSTPVACACKECGFEPRSCIEALLAMSPEWHRDQATPLVRWRLRRGGMARWRRAFEAHRDARLVFRAARDGRPLELQKRLRLGAKAGGLELKGEVETEAGEVKVVGPLEAARLGEHGECVRLLLEQGGATGMMQTHSAASSSRTGELGASETQGPLNSDPQ